jgi:hypothetical protein
MGTRVNRSLVLLTVSGYAALAGASAQAQTLGGQNYLVRAQVPQVCTVELPVLANDRPPVNFSANGTSLTIDRLTDPESLAANAASVSVDFNAVCNYPHRIVVETQNNGLWRDAQTNPANGFADAVPYVATLQWGGVDTVLTVDAGFRGTRDFTVNVNEPAAGAIGLKIDIVAGASNTRANAPLLAGVYRDTIRVTVGPQ